MAQAWPLRCVRLEARSANNEADARHREIQPRVKARKSKFSKHEFRDTSSASSGTSEFRAGEFREGEFRDTHKISRQIVGVPTICICAVIRKRSTNPIYSIA